MDSLNEGAMRVMGFKYASSSGKSFLLGTRQFEDDEPTPSISTGEPLSGCGGQSMVKWEVGGGRRTVCLGT